MRQPDAAAAKAAAALEPLCERFAGETALIFASGPSLTQLWSVERPIPCPAIAVSDAWRIAPSADVLCASDARWWRHYHVVPEFGGAKVSCDSGLPPGVIQLMVSGQEGYDPRLGWIRHGHNSGAAAVHLAAQLGAVRIVLVGFDMRAVGGKVHWFGDHPRELRNRTESAYPNWVQAFGVLAKELARHGVEILNATPGSALLLPTVDLETVCLSLNA